MMRSNFKEVFRLARYYLVHDRYFQESETHDTARGFHALARIYLRGQWQK